MFTKKALVAAGVGATLMSSLLGSSAGAAASLGISTRCDSDGHCVEGTATSTNGGITLSVIPSSENEVGTALAVCKGTGPGAALLEITCSIGNNSETMSFPGSAGAVPLVTTTGALARMPVCWSVTGLFPVLTGGQHHTVGTSGCPQLAV